jgi:hypothetical protein
MKRILLPTLIALFLPLAAAAQTPTLSDFIEKYKTDPAFTYAFLSKDLFEVVSKSEVKDQDWRNVQRIVQNLGSLRILAADEVPNGSALYREARALVPAEDFDELLAVRDGSENVRIWAKSEGNSVTDLVLLVGSPQEFVLVCFAGNLELGNISDLASIFDPERAAQLARTAESVAIDFSVSPNPNDGQFVLNYTDAQDAPAQLTVIDQNGRLISTLNLLEIPTQQVTLPSLPTGLYWLQLRTRSGKIGVEQVQIVKK